MIDGLLSTAIECKVERHPLLGGSYRFWRFARHQSRAPPNCRNPLAGGTDRAGPKTSADPQPAPRAEELRAAGLPEVPRGKPPFLIDCLVIRKQSPEKPDEVRIRLCVVAYVMPEAP